MMWENVEDIHLKPCILNIWTEYSNIFMSSLTIEKKGTILSHL